MSRNPFRRSTLRLSELTLLSSILSAAASVKQPLCESLELLSKKTTTGNLSNVLSSVSAELQRGADVTQAFLKYEFLFGTFFCSIVAYGETAGNFVPLFAHLSSYYEKNDCYRKKISRILKYPVLIVTGATGTIIALLTFVIPSAVQTIRAYAGDLPAATKIALAAMTFLTRHSQAVFISSLVFCALCACLLYANARLQRLEHIAWRMPLCGKLWRKNALRRISLTLSFLLTNGLRPSQALKMTAETTDNISLKNRLLHAAQNVSETIVSLTAALKAADIFPPSIFDPPQETIQQRNGDEIFKKIAEFYEEEAEAAVTAAVLVIEPAVIAIAGLLGGGMLLALYLPLLRALGR